MSDQPTNGTSYRLSSLERRLDRIESLEPAVMRQEIRDVKEDLHQIARDIGGLRKTLLGFVISFSIASITIAVLIISGTHHA